MPTNRLLFLDDAFRYNVYRWRSRAPIAVFNPSHYDFKTFWRSLRIQVGDDWNLASSFMRATLPPAACWHTAKPGVRLTSRQDRRPAGVRRRLIPATTSPGLAVRRQHRSANSGSGAKGRISIKRPACAGGGVTAPRRDGLRIFLHKCTPTMPKCWV